MQAVLTEYTKDPVTQEITGIPYKAIYENMNAVRAAIEDIEKETGPLFWSETQIGYQLWIDSDSDTAWEDATRVWEIAGWDGEGECEIVDDEGDED